MATMKKFCVSVNVTGKVAVSVFFKEITADSEASAMSKAISKVCASGELSPRACALLKEAEKRSDRESGIILEKIHGVELYVWAGENRDKSE